MPRLIKATSRRWMKLSPRSTSTTAPAVPGLPHGREGVKQAFQIFWEATPGYHRIDDQIAEGDKVVTRLTAIGKHEGDLPGAPHRQ